MFQLTGPKYAIEAGYDGIVNLLFDYVQPSFIRSMDGFSAVSRVFQFKFVFSCNTDSVVVQALDETNSISADGLVKQARQSVDPRKNSEPTEVFFVLM